MRRRNAGGSEAGACGNAARCLAALLAPELGRRRISIETAGGGVLEAEAAEDGLVTVDMGRPRFGWREIPLALPCADTRAIGLNFKFDDGRVLSEPTAVNVGNPHCIFWVADADAYDLAAAGPVLERHSMFPERANISLAEVLPGGGSSSRLKLRVWERGAGLTRACGTAACAAAVGAARTGRTGRKVAVELPGGALAIEWRERDDHILMTGPVEFEFDGTANLSGAGLSFEAAAAR
jgi:diaminopimelate epimerase